MCYTAAYMCGSLPYIDIPQYIYIYYLYILYINIQDNQEKYILESIWFLRLAVA